MKINFDKIINNIEKNAERLHNSSTPSHHTWQEEFDKEFKTCANCAYRNRQIILFIRNIEKQTIARTVQEILKLSYEEQIDDSYGSQIKIVKESDILNYAKEYDIIINDTTI